MFTYCLHPMLGQNCCNICPGHWTISVSNMPGTYYNSSRRGSSPSSIISCQSVTRFDGTTEARGDTKVFNTSQSGKFELWALLRVFNKKMQYMTNQVLILLLNIYIFYRNYYFVRHVIRCFVHYVPEEPMNHHQIVIKRESYPKTHQHHHESQIHQLYPASKQV